MPTLTRCFLRTLLRILLHTLLRALTTGACMLLLCPAARAQSCTVAATAITFPDYSPIALASQSSTGTLTATCTWPPASLAPQALICLNLTAATPRTLSNGANKLSYDLYTDPTHTLQWSASNTAGFISVTVLRQGAGLTTTSNTGTATFYGLVAANQPTVPTVGNASTAYTATYAAQTSATVGFYALNLSPTCSQVTTSAGTFPFVATENVINDCTINASNIAFATGSSGLLNQDLLAQGAVVAACTANDAFKITLSAGASNAQGARTMLRSGGGGAIRYQLYTDAGRTTVWGDGTNGTAAPTGLGTGGNQTIAVYGKVPAQATPQAGTYSDTITATIYF